MANSNTDCKSRVGETGENTEKHFHGQNFLMVLVLRVGLEPTVSFRCRITSPVLSPLSHLSNVTELLFTVLQFYCRTSNPASAVKRQETVLGV